jgi:hypothetical protein
MCEQSESKATIQKQSLVDWFVSDDKGVCQARITKAKGAGYNVHLRMFNFTEPYFYPSFKEAKACAMDVSAFV